MTRVEIITGDASVDVRRRHIERGVLHPAHLGILYGDRHFTRKVVEHPTQFLDVHRSPNSSAAWLALCSEKARRAVLSMGAPAYEEVAGLATLRGGHDAVSALVADPDPLVRAAALAALSELGCNQDDFAAVETALLAPAWQVREGAARALSGATAELAVPRLSEALADTHLDVRKAAVLSLTRWAGEPATSDALGIALKDSDADVRAYARRALEDAE